MRRRDRSRDFFFSLVVAISCCHTPAFAVDPYATGVKQLTAKQFAAAITSFNSAIKANPKNAMAVYYLGLAKHYQGDTQGAMEAYSRVLSNFAGSEASNLAVRGMSSIDPTILDKLGLSGGSRPQARPQQTQSQSSGGGSQSQGSGNGTDVIPRESRVNFTRESDCMIVDARVNGRDIKMMFDTGAANTVLGINHLEQMGLPVPTKGETVNVYGSGSTGANKALVHYVDLQLGGVMRRNFPVVLMKHLDNYPLIGQSFLRGIKYTVNGGSGFIHLQRADAVASAPVSASDPGAVPFVREDGEMCIQVMINGRPVPMWLDSGASWPTFTMAQARAAGIEVPDDAQVISTRGAGGSSQSKLVRVRSIKLGPVEKYNVEVSIVDRSAQTRPLLGGSFLNDLQYTIDSERNVVHFRR